jgi:hypothetical protein
MLTLDPYLLLLLIACLFILVFGGLGYIRREGLSSQFALEAVGLTALLVGAVSRHHALAADGGSGQPADPPAQVQPCL